MFVVLGAAVASPAISVAGPDFLAYEGRNAIHEGQGGEKKTVDGIDFWSNRDPPHRFQVLGSLTDFVDRGAVTVAYVERSDEAIPFTGITIAIRDSSNEYVHGTVSITPQQLPAVIDNLERLYSESATANDDLKYENETLHFLVDVNPHDWVKLGIFGDGALAGKTCRSVDGCRKTLRKFIDMLKAGQTMLHQQ